MKNKGNAMLALKMIAEQEAISVKEVIREIALAINDARSSCDPEAQEFWQVIGKNMSPEELIEHIAVKLNQ